MVINGDVSCSSSACPGEQALRSPVVRVCLSCVGQLRFWAVWPSSSDAKSLALTTRCVAFFSCLAMDSFLCEFCLTYEAQFYAGKQRTHCCNRCRRTLGTGGHSPYCVAVGGPGSSDKMSKPNPTPTQRPLGKGVMGVKKSKIKAPRNTPTLKQRPKSVIKAPRNTPTPKQSVKEAVIEAPLNNQRLVISLGRCGPVGAKFLQRYPMYPVDHDIDIYVNAEELLHHSKDPKGRHDWNKRKGQPDGRNPKTQANLRRHPNCNRCLRRIISKVMELPLTVVMCKWGKHRSVGCLEMALDQMKKCPCVHDLRIHHIHIDLNGPSGMDDSDWELIDRYYAATRQGVNWAWN